MRRNLWENADSADNERNGHKLKSDVVTAQITPAYLSVQI